jgi:tetratricopeptide (TPR) repeat protein
MGENPRIEELKRRVQVDPASIAFAALAEEYRRAGRFEEAISTCQAGLQRHPAYLSAHVTLGRALLETGQFDEARAELEHVLRAAPENLAAIRGLAEIHNRRGDLPEALEHYRSALHVAKNDSELEATVEELSKRVAAPEPAQEPVPPVAAPMPTISLASSTPVAPTPKPAPKPPPLELVTWVRADAEAEAQEAPIQFAPPFATEPAQESRPDPTLSALEDLLAAILRERDQLSVESDLRR